MLPLRQLSFFDDFAYIQTAERLATKGELKVSEWSSSAIIFQTFWSTLFTKVFGYSIPTLHLSNIVLLLIALIFFYKLLKLLDFSQFQSTIFTLFLLSYPWVFQFSYTYMTDVFYMSLFIISYYFTIHGLKTNKRSSFLLGSIFAGFTFLTRQIGIVIPLSLLVILICQLFSSKKLNYELAIFQFLPFTIIFFCYYFWQQNVGMTATLYYTQVHTFYNGLLPYIIPFKLGMTGITNSLYLELLIQRSVAYLNIAMVFILPLLFFFKIDISHIIKIISNNFRAIVVTTFVILFMYQIDFYLHNKFSATFPHIILSTDTFLDWQFWWSKLVYISIPIWIVLIAVTFKKSFETLFVYRNNKHKKLFNNLTTAYVIFMFFLFIKMMHMSYPSTFNIHQNPISSSILSDLLYTIDYFFSASEVKQKTIDVFLGSWFFFMIAIFAVLGFLRLVFYYQLSLKVTIPTYLFLSLTFILQLIFILVFAHFYWDEYIIQFIPLIIIWIAIIFRNAKIHKLTSIIIVTILLIFSLQITRNRYQTQGVHWELATKLITEKNVNPYNISDPNWAWRPYWFFESSFEQMVKKNGGNKYEAVVKKGFGHWNIATPETGDYYNFIEIPSSYQNGPINGMEVIYISEPYWAFYDYVLPTYKRHAVIKVR